MSDETENKPPYLYAALTFAVIFAIYIVTLSPTTAFWDTSEYIAAAKVLGIPHPPGNPLFTLLAHVWGLLPLAENYAKRINLFAAVTSAGGAAFWFLVADRWLRNILPMRIPRQAAAFAGVFASAMAWTVWNQSTVNEKVYTVSLFSIALTVWCAIRWADSPPGERRDRWLVAAVYLLALSSTNHMMGALAAPVVGVYVLLTDWRVITRPRVLAAMVGVLLVGISLNYLYLPMRSAQLPPINEGEPICKSIMSGILGQCQPLSDVLNRVQYMKPPVSQRMSDFGAQLSMYWEYWSWQWGRDLGALKGPVTGFFTALGITGLYTMIRRDRRAGLAAGALAFTLTLLLIYYLNFRYGFSYHTTDASITNDMREVRERDYFFLASFAFAGVLMAAGFAAVIRGVAEWVGDRSTDQNRWYAGMPVLALALIPLVGNRVSAPRNNETIAADFATDILESVEPYGILITAGDNDTFPLWFAQEVLGIRRDVTLANLSLMNTDWHLRQIQRRVVPDFDPASAAPIWRLNTDTNGTPITGGPPKAWAKPTTPVFGETTGWLDSIPEAARVGKDSVAYGNVYIKFGSDVVTKSDIAAVLLIKDNIGKRPIYFSWSDGTYPDQTLGLGDYLVSQGMVRKLMPDRVKVGGPIRESQYLGLVDVDRTRSFLFGVYHPEAAAHDRPGGWFDPPSASILQLYQIVYAGFAPTLQELGDSANAMKAMGIAERIRVSMGRP